VLLNYHIGRFVLSSLCDGDFVRLALSSVRVAVCVQPATRTLLTISSKYDAIIVTDGA